jgi:hypothetical protein
MRIEELSAENPKTAHSATTQVKSFSQEFGTFLLHGILAELHAPVWSVVFCQLRSRQAGRKRRTDPDGRVHHRKNHRMKLFQAWLVHTLMCYQPLRQDVNLGSYGHFRATIPTNC